MSIFCDSGLDGGDFDWWWYEPKDEAPLTTKRSRKCCSCGERIAVGAVARKVLRFRKPTEFEEDRGIYSDEVPLADWYLCEACGDVADSLAELGFCYNLGGESLKDQIAEYRKDEAAHLEYLKTHNKVNSAANEVSPLE